MQMNAELAKAIAESIYGDDIIFRRSSTPLNVLGDVSLDDQELIRKARIGLCYPATIKKANEEVGVFIINFESSECSNDPILGSIANFKLDGYSYDWMALELDEEELELYRSIEETDSSGYSGFLVLIKGHPSIPQMLRATRYRSKLASEL